MFTRQTLMSTFLALTLLTATQVSQGVPVATGLEGYWQFEGDGNDSSGNSRDLDLHGGLEANSPGLFGTASYFPGDVSKFAQRPSDDSAFDFGSNDFTIQIWCNLYDNGGTQVFIEKFSGANGPGWTISHSGFWANSSSSLGTLISLEPQYQIGPTDVWHQYTVRRTGNLIQYFYDSNPVGGVTVLSGWAMGDTNMPLLIGRRNPDDNITSGDFMPVRGRLDEIAIWNRALTDDDIDWLYNGGDGNPAPEPATLGLLLIGGLALLRKRNR